MERCAQVGQCSRRSHHDPRLCFSFAYGPFERCSNPLREAMLLKFVPIGLFNAATLVCTRALEDTAGPIGALFVRGRIVIDEDALGP